MSEPSRWQWGCRYHGLKGVGSEVVTTITRIGFIAAILLISGAAQSADSPLVFVQTPLSVRAAAERYTPQPVPGSRIVRLDPTQSSTQPMNLTPEFVGAQDPDVSFDGSRILFAGKRTEADSWDIWEMRADGSEKRCLDTHPGDDFQPVYAGCLNTLNDPEWDQILFVSDAAGTYTEDGSETATALYTCKLDGTFVHRISYNLSSDFDPYILRDGRALFTSWQQDAGRHPPRGLLPLFVVCTDGIDMMPFYGNHEPPRIKRMARETSDGHVVFIVADRPRPLGGGGLARVSMRRNLHSYEVLSSGSDGAYHSPCPTQEGGLLVSYRESDPESTYGIYAYDTTHHRLDAPVFDDPNWHDIDAHVLSERTRPRGRSTVVNYAKNTGWLYCLDPYQSDRPDAEGLREGSIKRLRLIEGIPVGSPDVMEGEPTGFAPRRILGDVQVESDGSFHLQVPAMTPFSLQLLDENGLALATHRSWTWVMPMERRGCIGCHEDRERTPANEFVDAMQRKGWQITLPPERRRTVGFRDNVWPVLQSSCLVDGCHVSGGAGTHWGEPPRQVYDTLLTSGEETLPPLVRPGYARDSRLLWVLFARRMDDSGGASVPGLSADQTSGHANVLDPLARQKIIEWIDLGAPWKSPSNDALAREGE